MRFTTILFDFKKVGELTKAYSNLPDSYIKRSMEQIIHRTPKFVNYLPRETGRKKINFTMDRPWTLPSKLKNPLHGKLRPLFLEPIKEWTIFRGDRVEILAGKDKGKHGIVVQIIQERNWVIVDGLNCQLRTIKRVGKHPACVAQVERPLRVNDQVSLVDPSDMMPCKVEWRYTENGERVRVSTRTGRILPLAKLAEETKDYKTKASYLEQPKDTKNEDLAKVTFVPLLRTFEMDIMEKMGIKEDRTPAQYYWY